MKPRLMLEALPPGVAASWRITLLAAATVALIIFLVVSLGAPLTAGLQTGLYVLQLVVLVPMTWIAAHSLNQSHRVLVSRVAPLTAWRCEARDVCITVFAAWTVSSAATIALTLFARAGPLRLAEAASNGGVIAVLMVLLTAGMAAQHWSSRWGWRWASRWVSIAVALSMFALAGANIQGYRISDLREAPLLVLSTGALLLALFLFLLYRCTAPGPLAQPGTATGLQASWATRLHSWFRRPYLGSNTHPWTLLPVLFISALGLQFGFPDALFSVWGEDITAWNLMRVLILASYASHFLASGDLHVRKLLAPGGFFRRRLGQRIIASTLIEVVLFAVLLAVGIKCALWALPSSMKPMGNTFALSSGLPLASEVVFAVCLATLVRGFSPSSRTAASLLLVCAFMVTGALLWALDLMTPLRYVPGFGSVGAAYVAALLALAAALTAASNRVWARADLAGLYRKQQSPDTPLDQISNALWGIANRPSSSALRRFLKGNR